jgi:hypothetical protein
MYKALIEPNIGMDYISSTGFSPHSRESSFCVGLHGIREDDVSHVLHLIDSTFEQVREREKEREGERKREK